MKTFPLLALLATVLPTYATGSPELHQLAWTQHLESDAFEYRQIAAALSPKDGVIWVALASRPKGTFAGPERSTLWKLSRDGMTVQEFELGTLVNASGVTTDHPKILDLGVLQSGTIMVVAEESPGKPWVITLDATSGRRSSARRIEISERPLAISKVMPLFDGNALLIGGSEVASLVKISPYGEVIWQKGVADSEVLLFLGGALTQDGGFVLTGATGLPKGAPTRVWVGMFSPEGALLHKGSFAGDLPSIASMGNGFVVAYKTSSPSGWDMWLRGLGMDLGIAWETRILSGKRPVWPFQVVAAPGGECVVAGSNEGKPWASRFKNGGEPRWSYTYSEGMTYWLGIINFSLLSSDDNIVESFTIDIAKTSGEARRSVRVIKF